jgi:lactoylglutathione lyase
VVPTRRTGSYHAVIAELTLRVELFPRDIDAFVSFYVGVLRFSLVRDDRPDGGTYVALQRGDVRIGAVAAWEETDGSRRLPPHGIEIVLETDDLEHERAAVRRAGWELAEDVVERPWGLRDFRLLDPDGHYIRVTTRA